jgi:hypothetical protein
VPSINEWFCRCHKSRKAGHFSPANAPRSHQSPIHTILHPAALRGRARRTGPRLENVVVSLCPFCTRDQQTKLFDWASGMVPIDKCVIMCRPSMAGLNAAEGVTPVLHANFGRLDGRRATASGRTSCCACRCAGIFKVTFCCTLFSLSVRKLQLNSARCAAYCVLGITRWHKQQTLPSLAS